MDMETSVEAGVEVSKRAMPVGMCTSCNYAITNVSLIGHKCPTTSGGKSCKGTLRSAQAPGDWTECAKCHGTGDNSGRCMKCSGVGWLFTRPGGFDGQHPAGVPIVAMLVPRGQ